MQRENNHLTRRRATAKASGARDPYAGLRRGALRLAGAHDSRARELLAAGDDVAAERCALTAAGELVVSRTRCADAVILWLSGELDRATSALLQRELDGAHADDHLRVVVDLTGLEFMDAHGLQTLLRAHQRACENGQQLSFRQGPGVVHRLLALTTSIGPRSRPASAPAPANQQPCDFAPARAGADVDHLRPQRDRPRGTTDRSPDQAAAASDAPPSSASLAPRHFPHLWAEHNSPVASAEDRAPAA